MKTFRRLTLLGIALLETGCGLPDTYYLQPPTVVTLAPGPGYYQFSNPIHDPNHDINVNFTGDELYYKFYVNISDIEVSAYDPSNTSDPSVQLTAKGFWPVCLSTDSPPTRTDPVIAIGASLAQAGSTVTVMLLMSSAPSSFSIPSGPNGEVRRDVQNLLLPTTYKTFETNPNLSGNYILGDADMTTTLLGASTVYVAMYALSFGYTGTSTPQRSVPVYLGYLQFTSFQ